LGYNRYTGSVSIGHRQHLEIAVDQNLGGVGMDLWKVSVSTTSEANDAVAEALVSAGLTGVEIEDVADFEAIKRTGSFGVWVDPDALDAPPEGARVSAYLAKEPGESAQSGRLAGLLDRVRRRLARVRASGLTTGSLAISLSGVAGSDYLEKWKAHYHAIGVSDRLAVVPSWEWKNWRPRAGQIPLVIDPGVAFGTGVHETTVLCLRALEECPAGQSVLDVGTGTGILAIAAAKLGAERVLAVDLDPVAVSVAIRNVEANGVAGVVRVAESDLLQSARCERFDVIVANLLAGIVLRLLPDALAALRSGGRLLASGIVRRQAAEVAAAMRTAGLAVTERTLGDWVLLIGEKRG
jgi:ribosomal protein L11 methyltransferase